TNHARHHEITAIRAAGISLGRLCLPYLAIGFIGSVLLFALNELWVPDSADRAERISNRRLPPVSGAPQPDEIRNLTFVNSHAWWSCSSQSLLAPPRAGGTCTSAWPAAS